MQHIERLNTTVTTAAEAQPASSIPKLTHAEAAELAAVELQRFLNLVDTLEGDDWTQPTACTLWNVREIVAHQAGWESGWSSFGNVMRLFRRDVTKPYVDQGMIMLDAVNQSQVEMRADRSTDELIAEIREQGPRSIAFRKGLPGFVRALPMPDGAGGLIRVGYLLNTILTRDMWMHRVDICRATGRDHVQTNEHDGRIVALVVRDLAKNLKSVLGEQSVVFDIQGISGGCYRLGTNPNPAATITLSVIDFNLLASGRSSAEELQNEGRVRIEGDEAFGSKVVANTSVLY